MGIFFFLIWGAVNAFAQPSPDVVQWIKGSLHPGITYQEDAPRGEACAGFKVRITGADPVSGAPRQVQAAIYAPASSDAPDVIVMPPTGGENAVDRAYASALCDAGLRASIVESWFADTQRDLDLGTYDRSSLRTLAAVEHLLEYLKPARSVGVLGTSLGALGAAFVLGFDARVTTGVLIVGGDHLNEIIARSTETGVSTVRRKQMKANGLSTVDEFETALRSAIHVDPGTFADYSGPKRLSMYVATQDTTVPTKNQLDLVRAFGSPRMLAYEGAHIDTILHTYWAHEGDVVSFLAERPVKNEPNRFFRLGR